MNEERDYTTGLGGQDYITLDLYYELKDKVMHRRPKNTYGCRRCGAIVYFMGLHDRVCPALPELIARQVVSRTKTSKT